MENNRYSKGLETLRKIDPTTDEGLKKRLADIAPDFSRLLVEFAFGDLYSRPALDPKSREIAIIAALTALGTAAPQLRVHIEYGLRAGLTREQIAEVIMQMTVYAGFPAALNGLFAAKEVFAQTDSNQ